MKSIETINSKYTEVYAFITPEKGVFTLKDQKTLLSYHSSNRKGIEMDIVRFNNKEFAVKFLKSCKGKLSKKYRVIICSGRQMELSQHPLYVGKEIKGIQFTEKQIKESFIVG